MRFSFVSLLALGSSLFAGAIAAPYTGSVETVELARAPIEARGECEVCDIMTDLVYTVKSFTASINVTISECEGIEITVTKKISVIAVVKDQCKKIIGAINVACSAIGAIKGGIVLALASLQLIVSLVVELVLEIVCTLLHVIAILKCTILELLGFVLTLLFNAILSLIIALAACVKDILGLIKDALFCHVDVIVQVFFSFSIVLKGL